jgi:acetyl esterase
MIDSRTRRTLLRIAEEIGMPACGSVTDIRRWYDQLMASNGPGPDMWAVKDCKAGARRVPVRVLRPIEKPAAAIVFFHGGGWIAGSIAMADTIARKLAERTGCTTIVPDYSLAPENPFPAAVLDAREALAWANANLADLTGEQSLPIIVAGEGAGGNLAAAAALRARDQGPALGLQILVSPILDCVQRSIRAASPSSEPSLVTPQLLEYCLSTYLPCPGDRAVPDASPLRAASLRGLPPTVLLAAEDEPPEGGTAAFASRLCEAGVEVQLQRYRGLVHGAFGILRLPIGEKPFQGTVRAARAYLARPDHPLPQHADPAVLAALQESPSSRPAKSEL